MININEVEKKLIQYKEEIDRFKSLQIKSETRMEELLNQKKETENEIKAMGYNPDNLEEEIKKKTNEIRQLMTEIESLKPQIQEA